MNNNRTKCRSCEKKGGVKRLEHFGIEGNPGLFCTKCSVFFPDHQTVREDVQCVSCKKSMGTVSRLIDVVFNKVLVHKGKEPKKFRCPECSDKMVKSGQDDPDVRVRYAVMCVGGCGKQQGWQDEDEGDDPGPLNHLSCPDCDPKLAEIARNNRSIDGIIKNI